jgi:Fe-S cluster assembly protein SufD
MASGDSGSNRTCWQRDATVETLHIALGGKLSRATVRTSLAASGASAKMLGLVVGSDRQLFDHHTQQNHFAPHTTSDLLYKSALKDQSRSVFAGLIRAGREAQKTDAVQTSRNLLLNAKARADAIPMLEIEANDLRCTHAATVAPVDEEQLFFLRSRGLSRTEAQQMIVEGFVEPVIAELPAAGLREALSAFVAAKVAAD